MCCVLSEGMYNLVTTWWYYLKFCFTHSHTIYYRDTPALDHLFLFACIKDCTVITITPSHPSPHKPTSPHDTYKYTNHYTQRQSFAISTATPDKETLLKIHSRLTHSMEIKDNTLFKLIRQISSTHISLVITNRLLPLSVSTSHMHSKPGEGEGFL